MSDRLGIFTEKFSRSRGRKRTDKSPKVFNWWFFSNKKPVWTLYKPTGSFTGHRDLQQVANNQWFMPLDPVDAPLRPLTSSRSKGEMCQAQPPPPLLQYPPDLSWLRRSNGLHVCGGGERQINLRRQKAVGVMEPMDTTHCSTWSGLLKDSVNERPTSHVETFMSPLGQTAWISPQFLRILKLKIHPCIFPKCFSCTHDLGFTGLT